MCYSVCTAAVQRLRAVSQIRQQAWLQSSCTNLQRSPCDEQAALAVEAQQGLPALAFPVLDHVGLVKDQVAPLFAPENLQPTPKSKCPGGGGGQRHGVGCMTASARPCGARNSQDQALPLAPKYRQQSRNKSLPVCTPPCMTVCPCSW
jgi:hypothetical protein